MPMAKVVGSVARGDGLADEVGGAVGVGGVDDLHGALRVHDDAARRGSSARAFSIWSTVKRWCTEQKPCQRMTRESCELPARRCRRAALRGFHIGICSSGTPMALAVLRPRCWSGKKSTRWPRSNAHSSTVAAFEEVQTMPPCSPQKPLSAAEEFM